MQSRVNTTRPTVRARTYGTPLYNPSVHTSKRERAIFYVDVQPEAVSPAKGGIYIVMPVSLIGNVIAQVFGIDKVTQKTVRPIACPQGAYITAME